MIFRVKTTPAIFLKQRPDFLKNLDFGSLISTVTKPSKQHIESVKTRYSNLFGTNNFCTFPIHF